VKHNHAFILGELVKRAACVGYCPKLQEKMGYGPINVTP